MSERAFLDTNLLDAASTLNATGTTVELNGSVREVTVYLKWSSGTTAGAVKIETAYAKGDADTWAALATVTWPAASRTDVVQITGCFRALRARVSTAVTGGTVTAHLVAN